VIAFEDWRIGDAARLLWYAWPEEFLSLPAMPPGAPGRWRNELAWRIFGAERLLAADESLPWEAFGVPIGLVACAMRLDAAVPRPRQRRAERRTRPLWAHGRRRRRAGHPLAAAGAVAGALRTARRADRRNSARGDPAPDAATLAADYARLPPFGLLPAHVVDLDAMSSAFFPASFTLDAAPLPTEQLDAALAEAASLAPLDLALGERVRLLVPVPQAVFEPRLLIREVIDPNSPPPSPPSSCSARARSARARVCARVPRCWPGRSAARSLTVPAIADDPEALEPKPSRPGGRHRPAAVTAPRCAPACISISSRPPPKPWRWPAASACSPGSISTPTIRRAR
jgi:hypothetical protein